MCAFRGYFALFLVLLVVVQVGNGYQAGALKPLEIPQRGTLRGTVAFQGQRPDLAALSKARLDQMKAHQDKDICLKAPQDQIDQRVWMIGPKGGLANVIVYVRPQPTEYFVLTPADLKPYQVGGAKHEAVLD